MTLVAVIVLTSAMPSVPAYAGKHPYPELTDELDNAVISIMSKHGLPIRHDRSNPWLGLAAGADAWIGGDPKYTVYFYQTDEIPRAAQLEVIDYPDDTPCVAGTPGNDCGWKCAGEVRTHIRYRGSRSPISN
jgi:hypothetical protein